MNDFVRGLRTLTAVPRFPMHGTSAGAKWNARATIRTAMREPEMVNVDERPWNTMMYLSDLQFRSRGTVGSGKWEPPWKVHTPRFSNSDTDCWLANLIDNKLRFDLPQESIIFFLILPPTVSGAHGNSKSPYSSSSTTCEMSKTHEATALMVLQSFLVLRVCAPLQDILWQVETNQELHNHQPASHSHHSS
jgi:hypothetical protein